MNQILVPKKHNINETEEIPLPLVKCSFCGLDTATGLHQTRLEVVKKGDMRIINGRRMYKPPVMKQSDYYMCTRCVEKGIPWPGQRP